MGMGFAASIGMLAALLAGVDAGAADMRGYAPAKWFLAIDGHVAGPLLAVETSQIVTPPKVGEKHVPLQAATARFRVGTAMSRDFHEWLAQAAGGTVKRRNLDIGAADFNFQLSYSLRLNDAVITEIDLPALDAASRDLGTIGVHIAAATGRRVVLDGGAVPAPIQPVGTAIPWLTSGYRLTVGTLDGKGVTHVDPVVIRIPFNPDALQPAAGAAPRPASVDLRFVVQGAAIQAYEKLLAPYRDSRAASGAKGLDARLDLLAPNGSVVYSLGLPGAAVTQMAVSRGSAGLSATIKLTSDRVAFGYKGR